MIFKFLLKIQDNFEKKKAIIIIETILYIYLFSICNIYIYINNKNNYKKRINV